MGDDERKRLLDLHPLMKITDKTVTDRAEIMRKLDEAKRLGYYVEVDEIIEGLTGVGVPIMDFSGTVVAALGATQPGFQIKEGVMERIMDSLVDAARAISKDLGYYDKKE
jgi:DNA-binding IclR family transcriptional regulator